MNQCTDWEIMYGSASPLSASNPPFKLYFMLNLFSDPCLLNSFTGSQTVAKSQILQYQDLSSQQPRLQKPSLLT